MSAALHVEARVPSGATDLGGQRWTVRCQLEPQVATPTGSDLQRAREAPDPGENVAQPGLPLVGVEVQHDHRHAAYVYQRVRAWEGRPPLGDY